MSSANIAGLAKAFAAVIPDDSACVALSRDTSFKRKLEELETQRQLKKKKKPKVVEPEGLGLPAEAVLRERTLKKIAVKGVCALFSQIHERQKEEGGNVKDEDFKEREKFLELLRMK
jgi:hypothetical protein